MADSRIRDESYYQVNGWMMKWLGLKGTALKVYAIIYGFSQDGESSFTGSINYLVEFTNTSRQTVISALKALTQRGLLTRTELAKNGVKYVEYRVNLQTLEALRSPGQETLPGSQEIRRGSQEIRPNNKSLDNKSSDNKEEKGKTPSPAVADYSGTNFSEAMRAKVDEWLQYKAELRDEYTPTGLKSLITQIQNNVNKYGEPAVAALIGECMSRGWKGIIFDKLENSGKTTGPGPGSGGRREPTPSWMTDKGQTELQKSMDDMEKLMASLPKTAATDPEIARRAEQLKRKVQG